jgi:hypothetical protein
MAVELVNIGRIANDGTGDDLREAFVKVNRSLEDLDLRIDDKTEGANIGVGAGVFKVRNGYDLQFRSLTAGDSINITENSETIQIAVDSTLGDVTVIADTNAIVVPARQALRINGSGGVTTVADQGTNSINISGTASLSTDTNPTLNHSLNANGNDIVNVDLITANNIQSNIYGIDIRTHEDYFTDLDLGIAYQDYNVTNFIDYIRRYIDIDLGTLPTQGNAELNFGELTSP